jgi:hypothetical protein
MSVLSFAARVRCPSASTAAGARARRSAQGGRLRRPPPPRAGGAGSGSVVSVSENGYYPVASDTGARANRRPGSLPNSMNCTLCNARAVIESNYTRRREAEEARPKRTHGTRE